MGLFSFIASGISAVASTVTKVASSIGKIIYRPDLPTTIPGLDVVSLVKGVIDFFRGKKYDSSTASVDETKNINRDLSQYAKTFHAEANRVEEELLEKANDYFDNVLSQLEEMQSYDEFMKELPLHRIKKEVRELRKELRGKMKDRISRAYSLDNQDLLRILEVDSDNERVKQMEQYASQVLKIAVDEFLEKIEELGDTQITLVQDLILSQVNQISLTMKSEQALLQELESAMQQNEEELDNLKTKISSTIDLCDLAIEELKTA